MAVPLSRLGRLVSRHTGSVTSQRAAFVPSIQFRPFFSTPINRNDGKPSEKPAPEEFKFDYNDLEPEDKAEYDSLSPSEKLEYQEDAAAMHAHMNSPDVVSELNAEVSQLAYEMSLEEEKQKPPIPPRIKPGLMAMGEVDEQGSGEDGEFEGDDISSLAHGELEQHREIREMARIAAWEMPLLSSVLPPTLRWWQDARNSTNANTRLQSLRNPLSPLL